MDEKRFDCLARALTDSSTRRALLRLAAALLLAGWRTKRGEIQAQGEGNCDVCPPEQPCAFHSVREAVAAASPGDTLRLCPGTYREPLVNEPHMLLLANDLTLIGAGADTTILDGEGIVNRTVSAVGSNATVALEGLTITGGNAGTGQGGGIANEGDLTLTDCFITGNRALEGGGIVTTGALHLVTSRVQKNRSTEGGGIFHDRQNGADITVTLVDSKVTGNTADNRGGGIRLNGGTLILNGTSRVARNIAEDGGGGIYTVEGNVTLADASRVSRNKANYAGGIFTIRGSVMLKDHSSVTGNSAGGEGGGLYAWTSGVTLKHDSSVTENTAGGDGGGIIHAYDSEVTLEDNSHVSGNTAGERGGGLSIVESQARLRGHSHVNGNTAGVEGGGIFTSAGTTVTLGEGARVIDNQPDNCAGDPVAGCSR